MNKKQIILLIILSLLLVGLSYLNINKYLLNSNSSKTAETKDDEYHQALNNMKNLKNVSISKDANLYLNNKLLVTTYEYNLDLETGYISGKYIGSSEETNDIYLVKDNNLYYEYSNNSWNKVYQSDKLITYNPKYSFYNDIDRIINLLEKAENYSDESNNKVYNVKLSQKDYDDFTEIFTDIGTSDIPELLWHLKGNKISDLELYVTVKDNYIKEINFTQKISNTNNIVYYILEFDNYNKAEVDIPTEVLADLF